MAITNWLFSFLCRFCCSNESRQSEGTMKHTEIEIEEKYVCVNEKRHGNMKAKRAWWLAGWLADWHTVFEMRVAFVLRAQTCNVKEYMCTQLCALNIFSRLYVPEHFNIHCSLEWCMFQTVQYTAHAKFTFNSIHFLFD